MRLVQAQAITYRNILDTGSVEIEDDVTCLVGKNESGKTAFVEALHWLNPDVKIDELSVLERYPAWRERADRRQAGGNLEAAQLVRARFELTADDFEVLEDRLAPGVVTSAEIEVARAFNGDYTVDAGNLTELPLVDRIISEANLSAPFSEEVKGVKSIEDLKEVANDWRKWEESPQKARQAADALDKSRENRIGSGGFNEGVGQALVRMLPGFFYFPEYATLPATVDIQEVLEKAPSALSERNRAARSLLLLAATQKQFLESSNYERRKRELENVANDLTSKILEYWSQNPTLRVEIDIDPEEVKQSSGQTVVRRKLKLRIRDDRHRLTLPFDEKSTGFQWFFSFLASFSEFAARETPVVILLDEPALGLHAKAQKDFLRYIDEELADYGQVIYTTHSPFMVQPGALQRVRLVEDQGIEDGATVTSDALTIDRDTLFPLQGALGYDIAQHLLIAPHNLVVEGTSDFTYLSVISEHLAELGRPHLDDRWSVVPVGGADMIPTFVALLGGQDLDLTVLVDGQRDDHQKLARLAEKGQLTGRRIIPVAEVLGAKQADIEDVFDPEDYMQVFNASMGEAISLQDVTGTDPIVSQIERHLGIEGFNHGQPADWFLRKRDEVLLELSDRTLDRFEKLFTRINTTLPPVDGDV